MKTTKITAAAATKMPAGLTLQRQYSTGDWDDVKAEFIVSFLDDCVAISADAATHEDALAIMATGEEMRHDRECWYGNCRLHDYKKEAEKKAAWDLQVAQAMAEISGKPVQRCHKCHRETEMHYCEYCEE